MTGAYFIVFKRQKEIQGLRIFKDSPVDVSFNIYLDGSTCDVLIHPAESPDENRNG